MATQADLARHLGVTTTTIQELINKGIIERYDRGQVDINAARLAYIDHLRNVAAGREFSESERDEKSRFDRVRADKVEFELQIQRGEYVSTAPLAAVLAKVVLECRSRLLGLAIKLTPLVVGESRLPIIEDIITRAVYDCIGGLTSERLGRDLGILGPLDAAETVERERMGRRASPIKPGGKRRARKVDQQ